MQNIFTNIKCSEIMLSNANKIGILYFTTCFHGFAILRHVDPFVRMLHIYYIVNAQSLYIYFYIFLHDIIYLHYPQT